MFKPFKNVTIVGFGNKARNGKDTAASVFLDRFGSDARQFAFADALKTVARVTEGMTEKNPKLLQDVGMKWREKNKAVWIEQVHYAISEKMPRIALITDVRFINEAEYVRAMGGTLVQCVRLTDDGTQFLDPSRPADHPSEIELDNYDWDHVIQADNVGDLEFWADRIADSIEAEIYV